MIRDTSTFHKCNPAFTWLVDHCPLTTRPRTFYKRPAPISIILASASSQRDGLEPPNDSTQTCIKHDGQCYAGRRPPRCPVRIDGIIGKSRFLTRLATHRAILALLSHPCRNCQCIALSDCRIRCMPCLPAHNINWCCVSPSVSPRPSLLIIKRPRFRLEIIFASQPSASAAHFLTNKTSLSALSHL